MLAPSPTAPAAPAPTPKLHDVTVVTKKTYQCARVEGVPPEEFGISRNARNIKDSGYCYHEVLRRQADLISDGYDLEQIKGLPSHTSVEHAETLARDTVDESRSAQGDEGMNQANRLIKITEHYCRMDYEGDGKAKLYRVTTGGDQGDVLRRDGEEEIVEVDTPPFAAMTPVIVTHRFFGRSIADIVMDIQRIKTALIRGALDNLYAHNNPRPVVSESEANENTIDDLLVSRHGGIIRAKTSTAVTWQEVPDITASIYPALQYMDATREWRTGVSRQGQGTDPNQLQNQVATIANQMFNAAQAKTKLIARIFAETGIRDLFSLLHGVIRKNGSQAQTVRLRNEWVNVDPRDWKERNDMTVKVGLGNGSKQEQLAGAQLLIGLQKEGIAVGMVSPKNLFNSAKEFTKLLGHKDVDEFFTAPGKAPDPQDPSSAPIPPPPDPKQAEIAAKAQAEQEKIKADAAHQQMKTQADIAFQGQKLQFDMAKEQQKHDLEMQALSAKIEADRQKHQQDMQAASTKAMFQHQQSQDKANASIEVKHSADEMTAPLAQVLSGFGQHIANMQDSHTKMMSEALSKLNTPKRVRKNKDGSWQSESVQ